MIAAGALILLAGFLVGATTLGGVLVVPTLTALGGIPTERAVAAASAAMLAPAILAGIVAWRDRASRRVVLIVAGAASAGAVIGAASLALILPAMVVGLLAILALVGGVRGLARSPAMVAHTDVSASPASTGILAAVAGVISAITGTGGPVALWPLLTLTGQPVGVRWIAALAIQLPVAIGASASNMLAGRLDYPLAGGLAVLLGGGFILGQRLGSRVGMVRLTYVASLMLILVAAWLAASLIK